MGQKIINGDLNVTGAIKHNGTEIPYSVGMSNPMTSAADLIVGGSYGTPTRLQKGTAGQVLKVNSNANGLEWTNSLPVITTAPSAANTDGGVILVVLSSEPATKYSGYLYIITGSNS